MIVVAGEALVDVIVDQRGGVRAVPGGGPYNTARTIGRLGRPASFVGRLSTDRFGNLLRRSLEADGVATERSPGTDAPTTLAVAELDAEGAATYHFYVEGTSAPGLTVEEASRGLDGAAVVHLGALGLVLEPLATSLERAIVALPPSTLLSVDVSCRLTALGDADAYRERVRRILGRASLVKVSADDLACLAPGVEPSMAADGLLADGPTVVLVTDGARDVTIVAAHGRRTIGVPAVAVIDTVGAGDAFAGGLLAWWDAHRVGREALVDLDLVARATAFAVRAAARTCERAGADPPTVAELGGLD